MDILYYSNYCKHSQKIIQFLVKGNLKDKVSFICIDKRKFDPVKNQTVIQTENGSFVVMPPNIHSVPALLVVKQNYKAILGDEIIQYFEPNVVSNIKNATGMYGEPQAYQLGGGSIVSEQFTFYDIDPDTLSAKGKGSGRQMFNYTPASHTTSNSIYTPPDNYRPDKIPSGLTLDQLQQQRNKEIGLQKQQPPTFQYQGSI